jgi:hypothetical protein
VKAGFGEGTAWDGGLGSVMDERIGGHRLLIVGIGYKRGHWKKRGGD